MQKNSTKKIATFGMLIALAFILSYLETLIPLGAMLGIPGFKIGLANIVIVVALYLLGNRAAFGLTIIRVLLTSITFGNMSMLWFSIAGATLSFIVMALLKKVKGFSIIGVSVAGGVAHNAGQIIVAMFVMGRVMGYYFVVLFFVGTITGSVIGLLGAMIYTKLKRALKWVQ